MLYMIIDLFCASIVPLITVMIVFGVLKKTGIKKSLLIALFTLYIAKMLDLVGVPYAQQCGWHPVINLIPFGDLFKESFSFFSIFQFVANIALFIPLGILLPMIWTSFRKLSSTTIAGALLSICIELIQLFSFRVTAVDDLLMNTLGTVIGYLTISTIAKKYWNKDCDEVKLIQKHDCIELLFVVVLVFCAVLFVTYIISSQIYSLPIFKI